MNLTFDQIVVKYGKVRLLNQVYGQARENEILAIIGPSGCGKTTLLNSLTGRIKVHSGTITIDNKRINKLMRRQLAYVTQEDVFFPNLSLRETLMFCAMLRLPDYMSYTEKCDKMESIARQFDLMKCMDTRMGNASIVGLSGGERKRASIACEMLGNNSVVIADEPTSGLDSATALHIMELIFTYVREQQKIAIVALHQPSSRIFEMCSKILVLSSGQVAYYGPRDELLNFLANVDLHCIPSCNHSEFVLENLKENEDKLVNHAKVQKEKMLQKMPTYTNAGIADGNNTHIGNDNQAFEMGSLTSVVISGSEFTESLKWNTSFCTQFQVLCKRAIKHEVKNILSISRIVSNVIMTIFAGVLWFQVPHTEEKIQSRIGLLFFLEIFFGVSAQLAAIASFHREKPILIRERFAGMYRLSAYYLAKLISISLTYIIEPTFMFVVVYWMAGKAGEFWIFVSSLMILLLFIIGSAGLGIPIICLFDNFELAAAIGRTYYIGLIMLGGFYVDNDTTWFYWTKYLSPLYFTTESLTKLEFLYGSPSATDYSNITSKCTCGQSMTFEAKLEQRLPIWLDVIYLCLHCITYWFIGYVILRWVKRNRLLK